jgi:XisH protein
VAARDRYHNLVKESLVNAGWTVSHDPLSISIGKISIQIDLGLEGLIGAEKGTEKIAVEIKSFGKVSQITDFYAALGQYLCYEVALAEKHPDRILYLAVPEPVYDVFFAEEFIQKVFLAHPIKLLVYSLLNKEVRLWID